MTCIRFFSHKAKSYTELGEKLSWLLKAKDHLKIYLQETSRSSGRKKTTFFRKKMTAADVSRYQNARQMVRAGGKLGLKSHQPWMTVSAPPWRAPEVLEGRELGSQAAGRLSPTISTVRRTGPMQRLCASRSLGTRQPLANPASRTLNPCAFFFYACQALYLEYTI